MSAKHRGSGTIAYGGLARLVLTAAKLVKPHDNGATHAMAIAKSNLAKEPQALGYRLEPSKRDDDIAVVKWCGPIDLSADQLVGADGAKVGDARKNAPMKDAAKQALTELLVLGPIASDEAISKTMLASGCKEGTVHRAAKELRVLKLPHYAKGGGVDHWTWRLAPKISLDRTIAENKCEQAQKLFDATGVEFADLDTQKINRGN